MSKGIKKPDKMKIGLPINPRKLKVDAKDRNIVFSFDKLDFNEYFNLDCSCPNWSVDLLNALKDISSIPLKRFKEDPKIRGGTYRIHSLGSAKPPVDFPHNIDLQSAEQIRFGKSKGGVHGIMIENVFYVIWLDPLHNMYPNERYGGLIGIKPPTTCCGWRDEELIRLSEENKVLNELLEKY